MSEEKDYRRIVTMIGLDVAPWCEYEEMTVDDAVKIMIAEIYELRAYKIRGEMSNKYEVE